MNRKNKPAALLLALCFVFTLTLNGTAVLALKSNVRETTEEFVLPDIVDSVEAEEKGYAERLKSKETDLSTFVFKNKDGTNTMRVFSHPVKYVAENGEIKDISLDIKANRKGGYITANHEIITTFKNKLTEGISLEYNDVEVKLIPSFSANTTPVAELCGNGKTVTYEVDNTTSFVYELTYAGFKEDIVVEEYTGQTEYSFTLLTNGLSLCEEYGSYYLANGSGDVEACIGDIIVFTADERNNTIGSMTCETVSANEEYILTIHLDADYLADEKTVYPIRIDPTIEINYDNNGSGAIEDVTINERATFSGVSGSLYVGRHPAGSLSRSLMRFPNLNLDNISSGFYITAATVEIRDLMCQGDEDITVDCHVYNKASPSWSEAGTTTWSSVGSSCLGTLLDSHLISYGKGNVENHRYSFNILSAAQAWADGSESPAKGLVFKACSEFENQTGTNAKTWYKTFAAYNCSSYRPSLSITYGSAVDLSIEERYLLVGGTKQVACTTTPFGLSVTWTSNNPSVAIVNSAGIVTGISEGTAKITATHTNNSTGAVTSDYVYVYVRDSLGIVDGKLYYIMNYDSRRFLSLKTASDEESTNIYTQARSASSIGRWEVEKQSNGTYCLINDYSYTSKVLGVLAKKVVLQSDVGADCQKFAIYRINSGGYKGYYYIRYKQYFIAQDSNNKVYATTSLSDKAVWSFMAVEKRAAHLFSFQYSGFDTTKNNGLYRTTMSDLGYDAFADLINKTPSVAYSKLCSSDDVFVFRGHGNKGLIAFYNSYGSRIGAIAVNAYVSSNTNSCYIDSCTKNQLASLRCVMYLGCKTGADYLHSTGTYNLVDSTFDKGAHFVLGTTQDVITSASNAFLEGFLNELNENNSNLLTCINKGLLASAGYPITYVGDDLQYLSW